MSKSTKTTKSFSTLPGKFAFIFGDGRTGWMASHIGQREKDQHPGANLYWYDGNQMDSYLAFLGLKHASEVDALKADLANAVKPTITTTNCVTCEEEGFQAGLEKGRAEGQTKLEAYIEAVEAEPAPVEPTADKTTKQLLNELFHDRARLERYQDNFAKLAGDAAEFIGKYLQEIQGTPPTKLTQAAVDLLIIAGKLRQVVEQEDKQ